MKLRTLGFVTLLFLAPAPQGLAASATYLLTMTGAKEIGTVGDRDGLATGTISLDDIAGTISWNINYSNFGDATISGFHIHGPASVTESADVFIGLGTATTGGPGTLINSINATPASVAQVLANPLNYYVNIHTTPTYPGGAVRDQLGIVPEPTGAGLVLFAALALWHLKHRVRS